MSPKQSKLPFIGGNKRRSPARNPKKGNVKDFGSGVTLDESIKNQSKPRRNKQSHRKTKSSRNGRSSLNSNTSRSVGSHRTGSRSHSKSQTYGAHQNVAMRGSSYSGASARRSGSRKPLIVLAAVIVALLVFLITDAVLTQDKIHSRVSVGGLALDGMTIEEATTAIDETFSDLLDDEKLVIYVSEEAQESGAEAYELAFDYESLQEYAEEAPQADAFAVQISDVGAYLDSSSLAQSAYSVGRGWDFVFGRLVATIFGVNIDLEIAVEETSAGAVADILDSSVGEVMTNPSISYEDGTFVANEGNDGYMVVRDTFATLIGDSILDGTRQLVVPMQDVPMQVDISDAQQAAQTAQEAVASTVSMQYEDSASWTLDSDFLGQSISTFVKESGIFGDTELVAYVSLGLLEDLVDSLEGIDELGTPAQNVDFSYDGETLSYEESSTGIGPDYQDIASQLNLILFGSADLCEEAGELQDTTSTSQSEAGDSADGTEDAEDAEDADATSELATVLQEDFDPELRQVSMRLATIYPDLTYEDAVELGLVTGMISSYSTEFTADTNKAHNIKTLADILTNTVLAPGETFSINEIAGECNEEKGFKEANAIVNGQIESEIGGGICQVATTVYDAVFFGGYIVDERHNHSRYMSSYEDGMDAAIAWPYLDFRFTNNSDNYLLVLVDYTDDTVTCSLWGIDPGYEVDYEMISWEEGEEYSIEYQVDSSLSPGTETITTYGQDGHIVTIARYVYSADGELLYEDTFVSNYQPRTQIVVQGPAVTSSDTSSDTSDSS